MTTFIAESPFDTMPTRPLYRRGDTVRRNGVTGTVMAVSGPYVGVRFDSGRIVAYHRRELESREG